MLDRMNRLSAQETADAVATLSDAVETVYDLLERFFEQTDEQTQSRLIEAWPEHEKIDKPVIKRLAQLSRDLASLEDRS